eukprot:CAMPEP_0116131728 /NCGR_PEP_ID=MMETSP0329-20121206/9164_1 /TAXON_ID=697910 /ORGANISM="Pseudo-nitzschia arenysensis, Strain B593" /LENGTH=230 /DNA_ID=CAMNT_0003626185 /DNA_START=154 /DNA_END=846 /DNA_ORIENTATION=+
MWSNKGKKKFQKRTANVKSYLGGLQGLNAENDNDNNSQKEVSSCSSPISQPLGKVLVEIPEELDIADAGRSTTPTRNNYNSRSQSQVPKHDTKDDSAAIAEIANDLMDLDNYMMSVFYHSDDASVYTKATADTSYSCSNSSSSTISSRRRHRGAAQNRRRDDRKNRLQQTERGTNWLESMRNSSMNIFVDGEDGWTPAKGWSMQKKKEWESKPDGHWDAPIFDSKEHSEI